MKVPLPCSTPPLKVRLPAEPASAVAAIAPTSTAPPEITSAPVKVFAVLVRYKVPAPNLFKLTGTLPL